MKKYFIWIIPVLIIIIIILGGIILFNNVEGEYHFTGEFINSNNNIDIDVFLMRNKNGNLLTYNTNIHYSEEDIVAAQLYYLKDGEKQIILGNHLNAYNYSKRGTNQKEYGYEYIDNLLNNENNLYFDLCSDTACDTIFETIKLNSSGL